MDLLTLLVVLVGLAAGTVLVFRTPRLAVGGVDRRGATVPYRVVIPARNEARALPALLADLRAQTAPAERVVVVDDASSDGTAEVAAAAGGVEVRRAPPTPGGWNPKTWALDSGVADAAEPVLVFLDADVRLAPGALAAVLGALDRRGGLVSVAPRHDVGSLVEGLSLPFNAVGVMGAGDGWSPRNPAARAAFGPCLAIERSTYAAVGGHAADRADLLDDVALARRAVNAGHAVSLYRGGSLVRYRMYPDGARQAVDGWTKNIASGARRTALPVAFGVALWVTALLLPLVALVAARTPADLGVAALVWAVVAAHTTLLGRAVGRFGPLAGPLGPLLAVVFGAVVARSAVSLALGRPVRWKGRDLVQPRSGAGGN